MRESPKALLSALLLSALVLAGCGSDAPAAVKQLAVIPLKSSAVSDGRLPSRYTCDGRNVPPPLEWGPVPPGVGSLAVFVVGFTPDPVTRKFKLSVEWAVAGVNPALHRIIAGRVPAGAYPGVAGDGKRTYSICPKKGVTVHYQFEVYGLAPSVSISREFAGGPVLEVLASGGTSERPLGRGGFVANYTRS